MSDQTDRAPERDGEQPSQLDADAERLLDDFYGAEHAPAPREPLTLLLDTACGIDWRAARGSVERLGTADLDYILFVLGIGADAAGGASLALAQARELLHEDLDLLAAALADPDSELRLAPGARGELLLEADPSVGDELEPVGLYAAMLRLSLMYVTDAAGLRRPGAPPLDDAPPAERSWRPGWRVRIPRTRSRCPHAQRSRRRA